MNTKLLYFMAIKVGANFFFCKNNRFLAFAMLDFLPTRCAKRVTLDST